MNDYLEFTAQIKRKTGIDLSLYKEVQMKRRLTALRDKKECKDFTSYFKLLNSDQDALMEFLDRVTINVTEFYRNFSRWDTLQKKVLPLLLKNKKTLKVWSAACSTGEEPYTIAMILNQFMDLKDIKVSATDLDENVMKRAQVGLYPERSLQEIPDTIKQKYFTKDGTTYKIDDSIKRCVTFKKHNLLSDNYDKDYDLIVCRNVMIYFTEEAKDEIYRKFSQSLRPGGVLFVGSTEQIFNPSQYQFQILDSFFYQKG
ncbi:protein-glutamate O-methyltransferase CheR [Radiobacillus kanasensis]|uniref:CheR family methyltransferase n=1 Tax=Radiobacillus kanasensis TaxID=2844358 RepID=UPI001E38A08F|nr:protein-glutamate O-methyltransferase CheR [Radiobacillus kanasensis]UFT97624.1 protein-glutamate O-methyltransferase CheR [Radiobacillus kanasensis]